MRYKVEETNYWSRRAELLRRMLNIADTTDEETHLLACYLEDVYNCGFEDGYTSAIPPKQEQK